MGFLFNWEKEDPCHLCNHSTIHCQSFYGSMYLIDRFMAVLVRWPHGASQRSL